MGAAGLIVFLVIQFLHPIAADPPRTSGVSLFATNAPPAEVAQLLRAACYNCHADDTQWPWYAKIAPVSWWLTDHVNHGRRRMNFSDWPQDDSRRAARRWRSIASVVESSEMPLPSYTWMHPEARLSAAQRSRIVDWARNEADRLQPSNSEKESP